MTEATGRVRAGVGRRDDRRRGVLACRPNERRFRRRVTRIRRKP